MKQFEHQALIFFFTPALHVTATFYLLKNGAILPFKAFHVFLFSVSVERSFILSDPIL